MERVQAKNIRLVSSDLNGTLVHQHTMMDMIRMGFPHEPKRYETAKEVFTRQTSGLLSMKQAFETAGPLTKGLSLRNAIEYARSEMRFLSGFGTFIDTLHKKGVYFVINSTGYSVTTAVIKAVYGSKKICDVICNRLIFVSQERPDDPIEESMLSDLVRDYFADRKDDTCYDTILTSGAVELGIQDEDEKARLLFEMAEEMDIPRQALVHIGDTMGDSRGISEVARNRGMGIAFNYNEPLRNYLEDILENETIPGRIVLTEPKSETSDLTRVLDTLFPDTP